MRKRTKFLNNPADYREYHTRQKGEDDRLVTVATGAKLSGLSQRQIGYAIETGRLQAYKLDSDTPSVLVQLSELFELPEPTTGRPPKTKKLSAADWCTNYGGDR